MNVTQKIRNSKQQLLESLPLRGIKTPLNRFATMVWLSSHGVSVAPFGTIGDLYKKFNKEDPVVVWCTDGNLMMSLLDACMNYGAQAMGAMHVGQTGAVSVSTKVVTVGCNTYFIDYASTDSWKSNCGNYTARISKVQYDSYHPVIDVPVFSIDYVPANAQKHKVYAIDFDRLPGLRHTPIPDVLTCKAARKLIRSAMKHFDNNRVEDWTTCKN